MEDLKSFSLEFAFKNIYKLKSDNHDSNQVL